jgi:plastocyanin domain-containing protein
MKTLAHLLLTLFVVIGLAACNDQATTDETASDDTVGIEETEQVYTEARMEDGYQVVDITATAEGFQPTRFTVEEGVPTRLVITRTTDSACMAQFQIPDMGVAATDLPEGQPVTVEFTPDASGEYTFGCGMDMMVRGTIVVRS